MFRPSRDSILFVKIANGIEDALHIDNSDDFDLIFLDLWLPTGLPTENFIKVQEKFPGKPVIIYTAENSLHWHRTMFRLGAKGFINKNAEKLLIEDTIRQVKKGETVYSYVMTQYLSKRIIDGYRKPGYGLTKDQQEVVHLFLEGLPAKEIAKKMGRNTSTIDKHLKNVRRRFDVSSNVDLIKTILKINNG
jgi:DNA-binding NarL/FixJ family response regulator